MRTYVCTSIWRYEEIKHSFGFKGGCDGVYNEREDLWKHY